MRPFGACCTLGLKLFKLNDEEAKEDREAGADEDASYDVLCCDLFEVQIIIVPKDNDTSDANQQSAKHGLHM